MKKISKFSCLPVVLLLFIVYLAVGSSGMLLLMRIHNKTQVAKVIEKIPYAELLHFTVLNYPGAKDLDEIQVDGEFYDISVSDVKGDSITYYCYHDTKDKMINDLSNYLDNDDEEIKLRHKIFRIYKLLDVKYIGNLCNSNNVLFSSLESELPNVFLVFGNFYDTPKPPPKV